MSLRAMLSQSLLVALVATLAVLAVLFDVFTRLLVLLDDQLASGALFLLLVLLRRVGPALGLGSRLLLGLMLGLMLGLLLGLMLRLMLRLHVLGR